MVGTPFVSSIETVTVALLSASLTTTSLTNSRGRVPRTELSASSRPVVAALPVTSPAEMDGFKPTRVSPM